MTSRDAYFDNAKFILIFLVVFGHFLRSFIDDHQMIRALYITIYSFHMPAFIFIAGYFAKGSSKKHYIWNLTKKLVIPYLIFQLIYSLYHYFVFNKNLMEQDLFNPYWSLWFLLSLFFWHLLLIVFKKFDWKIAIGLAVLISLGIGYIDHINSFLSLSRTFVFFPFFLIGYFATRERIHFLQSKLVRYVSLMIICLVFLFFTVWSGVNYELFYGSKPYSYFEFGVIKAIGIRMTIYIISTIMMIGCLSLIPNKKFFFTDYGARSLYVYLLHGAFIKLFRDGNLENQFNGYGDFLVLMLVAFVITLLLSTKLIKMITQPIIELKISLLRLKWKQLKPGEYT